MIVLWGFWCCRFYLRIFLKVNNCKSLNVGFFFLFIYLVYYLYVNKCYVEGKMGICLGLIYNVIDLRKESFIVLEI